MVLALHVCSRYPKVVLWSLWYGGQVKGCHSALWSAGPWHMNPLYTRYQVMGSPPGLDRARHCRPAELDVTLVAYRSSDSEGLSERWKMVGRDEFSTRINQSKNNSSNIDNSINSCFHIGHCSYMAQLQKEQYWIVMHFILPWSTKKKINLSQMF